MKDTLTDEGTITLESVPTISSTSSITPNVALYASRTQPDNGWCWLGHDQLKRVEQFLAKKASPSVRSVLLAYAQLSSRNSNARSFPAAARLVANIARVSVSTLHEADAKLAYLGLIQIRQRKDSRGLDAPRMVPLCDELPELGASAWELVTPDELKNTAAATRRRRSDSGVRLGNARTRQDGHTKETPKERPKETLSLTAPRGSRVSPRERESWEVAERRLAEEFGIEVAEVQKHRRKHEANMAAGRAAGKVQGYPTPASLGRYLANQPTQPKAAPKAEKAAAAVQRAEAERASRWKQFTTAGDDAPPSFEEADTATRLRFMVSNEGAGFRALAASWSRNGTYYTLDEETGDIAKL